MAVQLQGGGKQDLPYNIESEASVLGAILIDNDALIKIADTLAVEDFYDRRHQNIYHAALELYEANKPIDVLTLSDRLKINGLLDDVGGPAYLSELTNFVPTAANVETYANIIGEKALRRRLIAVNSDLATLMFDETKGLNELIEEAETQIFRLSQRHIKENIVSIEEVLGESFERLDELHKDKGKLRGITTGFKSLDNILAGLQRSDLFVLAARPAMGKAQPLDAKILTADGWKLMGDIKSGDTLASVDGEPSAVTGVFPQGKKQIYKVTFSDDRSAEFCDEHLWRVYYRSWLKPRILTTEKVAEMLTRKRYQKRLWIDMFFGDFGTSDTLPISPWVLGILIGEGDFQSMRFSTADESVLQRMKDELGEGLKINHAGKYDYRIVQTENHRRPGHPYAWPNPLKEQLKVLDLWGKKSDKKFVPETYKSADRESRILLLQGLLDADGWVEKHKSVRFSTSSEQLADDVVDLARSVGAWASKKCKQTSFTYKGERKQGLPSFVICICFAEPQKLFSIPEKKIRAIATTKKKRPTFVSIEPVRKAEAQCIAVSHPSQLYITDDYIVTHNTAMVLNLAHNVATKAEQPVLVFSLEMSKEQLVDRMLSRESGVNAWALRTGNLTDSDFEKIGQAMGTLSEAQIFIDDTPGLTIAELRTKAKRQAHKHPLGLIIVDYLQLMSGGARYSSQANRVQEISEISRGLKGIARELNVPLIALSQLSRSVESRSPQIPQLSDLRESGSIEQDADVVAFLYREDYYNPDTDKQNILEVHIRKHRHGEVGNIELYFDREKQRITDIDRQHTPFDS
ncbi:MAG TPA: replicative DNA helicase [Candidatus Limnocylindria bacterium]|nr:replicative DNA helicase [Candidatus Limnocylindria bacterium]